MARTEAEKCARLAKSEDELLSWVQDIAIPIAVRSMGRRLGVRTLLFLDNLPVH